MRTGIVQFLFCASLCFVSPLHAAPGDAINELLVATSKDRSLRDSTVKAIIKIMENKPSDPGVPKAFNWLIRSAGVSEGSDYDRSEAFFKRIEKHHGDNDQLVTALRAMIGFREKEAISFLERLGENSKSKLVASTALIALASSFEFDDNAIDRYENALKKVIKNYPDFKHGSLNITEYAKQKLYASQNLRVGKVAPEIEGEDAMGKRFKLSDYRGKVVFLNFWGDW